MAPQLQQAKQPDKTEDSNVTSSGDEHSETSSLNERSSSTNSTTSSDQHLYLAFDAMRVSHDNRTNGHNNVSFTKQNYAPVFNNNFNRISTIYQAYSNSNYTFVTPQCDVPPPNSYISSPTTNYVLPPSICTIPQSLPAPLQTSQVMSAIPPHPTFVQNIVNPSVMSLAPEQLTSVGQQYFIPPSLFPTGPVPFISYQQSAQYSTSPYQTSQTQYSTTPYQYVPNIVSILPVNDIDETDPQSLSQRMDIVWNSKFSELFLHFPHMWKLDPTFEPMPDNWLTHNDHAKVRFLCQECAAGWTSMKGRVVFWILFDQINGGHIYFKLYGQTCRRCEERRNEQSPADRRPLNYQHSMWYIEEVGKVLDNLFQRVGELFYGFPQASKKTGCRAGKPRKPHDKDLCQACKDGVCRPQH